MKYKAIFKELIQKYVITNSNLQVLILGAGFGGEIEAIKEIYKKPFYVTAVDANKNNLSILKKVINNGTVDWAIVTDAETDSAMFYEKRGKPKAGDTINVKETTVDSYLVKTVKLSKYINKSLDLVSMDIQGFEYKVLNEAIQKLNKNVKYLHILTHSVTIEKQILKLLHKNKWKIKLAFFYDIDDSTDGLIFAKNYNI
tara:strand:+ start:3549 stop:4145 length:597 start_codon:yes stop_codon:yes gene_type:complete